MSGTTRYQFVLSANATMTSTIIDTAVENAGFAVTENLDYGSTYFWKVRATEPAESGWSTLAHFTVVKKPAEPVPPVIIQQVPPVVTNTPTTPPPQTVIVSPPPTASVPVGPNYLRAVIIIMIIPLVVVIALIIKHSTGRLS
jgi:hypothetical protein